MEAPVTAEEDGEWVRETVERLTHQQGIWVKPDLQEEDPGFEVIQGRGLTTFWVSQEWAKKRSEVELWDFLVDNDWPVGLRPTEPKVEPEAPVRTNDIERDKRIWEEGLRAGLALALHYEQHPFISDAGMKWPYPGVPEPAVIHELKQNPYATPQEAQGKLLEALQDRDDLLGALGPYALQMACSSRPNTLDQEDCGKCHNCRARALYSPIIKWIRKGYRRAIPPST